MTLKYLPSSVGSAIVYGLSSDTKPTSPASGFIFIEEDTGKIYQNSGGVWTESINSSYPQAVGFAKLTVSSTEPTSPVVGDLWVDTT